MLGVSRKFGIPELIEPAVKVLASSDNAFSNWSTDPRIVRHITVTELGTIGRMKEKILLARFALCGVPPISHYTTCRDKSRTLCSASWKDFWMLNVVPRLSTLDGDIDNMLWWIRTDCVAKASIQGMTEKCMEWTVDEVIANPGWRAETRIVEGAVGVLMVPEHFMLDPVSGDEVIM